MKNEKKKKKILGANWMGYCPNYSMRGENSGESSYCIFRSSREGYWRSLKKKILLCKAEAGMATANFQH